MGEGGLEKFHILSIDGVGVASPVAVPNSVVVVRAMISKLQENLWARKPGIAGKAYLIITLLG